MGHFWQGSDCIACGRSTVSRFRGGEPRYCDSCDADRRRAEARSKTPEAKAARREAAAARRRAARQMVDRFLAADEAFGLSAREIRILSMRHEEPPATLDAVGTELNLTRERVAQIEKYALVKIMRRFGG